MMQAVITGVLSMLAAVLIPAALLTPREELLQEELVVIHREQEPDDRIRLMLHEEGRIVEMPLEDYLVGVVLSEMPPSFHPQALMAQAVAARTYAAFSLQGGKHEEYDLCTDSTCCQAWSDEDTLRQKFTDADYNKGRSAVMQTAGEVVICDGQLIEAVYFSCAGGRTEDAVSVWGSDVPYLQSVSSPGEELAARYRSEVTYDHETFQEIAMQENPAVDFPGTSADWITDVIYTAGGGVDQIMIGGQWFAGTQIRRMYGLNSTNFTIVPYKDKMTFEVCGYGHRVGLSQYGANAMAQEGSDYAQILSHYYTGTAIGLLYD